MSEENISNDVIDMISSVSEEADFIDLDSDDCVVEEKELTECFNEMNYKLDEDYKVADTPAKGFIIGEKMFNDPTFIEALKGYGIILK